MSISNLLIRNLRDVFGENDPARRRAAIDELWTDRSTSSPRVRQSIGCNREGENATAEIVEGI